MTRTSFSWFQSVSITATPSAPARAVRPGAVQVRLVVLGRVVVHDDVDRVHVDAARRDVGRDEHRAASRSVKSREGALPGGLAQVAVDRAGLHVLALELLDQPVGAPLGAAEHERAVDAAGDRRDDLDLVHLVDEQEVVAHLLDGVVLGLDLVRDRVVQVARDQAVDAAVERRREQHRLVLALDPVEDLLHLRHEAHVRHAVGFVEHEHLHVGDGELTPLHQVDEAARASR